MEAYSKEEDRKHLANLNNHGNSKLFETRSFSNYCQLNQYEMFDVNCVRSVEAIGFMIDRNKLPSEMSYEKSFICSRNSMRV